MPKKKPAHTWTHPDTNTLYALFTYTDRFKKRKFVYRRARNASHAKDLYKAMEADYRARGEEAFDGDRMTFKQLSEYAKKHYVKEPLFANGLKVSGMKSWMDARQKLDVMCSYFGTRKIASLTAEDISAYRDLRLNTPTKRKAVDANGKERAKERSIASVQRELSLLRRVLNIARRKRWIPFNPFDEGGFISIASEIKRTRVISRSEEELLLAACEKEDTRKDGKATKKKSLQHLRPIIICGIDTGMRSGEMFKLRWKDVDLDTGRINVLASNTKVEQQRYVPVTPRLKRELERLWKESTQDMNALVFGITRIKRGWTTLCKYAEVGNATPHDLRHTAATRMIRGGMQIAEVSRILGHNNVTTTYRYVNADDDTVQRAGEALNAFHNEETKETVH